jgi:hypothetical protein
MRNHWLITSLLLLTFTGSATAQTSILSTPITFECREQRIGHVLELISATGNFYFSYAGTLFNKDSLVTIPSQTRSVRQLLDLLFHGRLKYLEDGRYLILLPAANKTIQAFPDDDDRRRVISGIILDERTGRRLADVSVYDPAELTAAMSKKDGAFTVRVKNKGWPVLLAVSKEAYIDTIIQLWPGSCSDLTISISPDAFPPKALLLSTHPQGSGDSIRIEYLMDSLDAAGKNLVPGVEATGFARILLSYHLRMQSLNLKKVFIRRPIQLSLVPGLSTNGPLNSQVTNKVSINIIGGYEAGLTGAELAGVFNIDKKKVTGIQAAGVLNVAGGAVSGVQLAGVCNKDLDSVHGFQAAGIINMAKKIGGVQMAPINHADTVKGLQYGYLNYTRQLKGMQLGVINYSRDLRGMQWGFINIADSSEGISLGPINIIRHGGLHELSFYADELSPLNLAFRSGTRRAYGIVYAGVNPGEQRRVYYGGFGYGFQFPVSQSLALRTEFTIGQLSPFNLHNFNGNGIWRLNFDLHWQAVRNLAVSFGPSFNLLDPTIVGGIRYQPLPHGYHTIQMGESHLTGWIGWHVAVNLF